MSTRLVRVVHDAVAVPGMAPPHDTVHLRVFHPALRTGSDLENNTGELPPDPSDAPWPVVVVLPGVNIGPEGYRWLAERWVDAGCAIVTLGLVGEIMPGAFGITPGMDLDACRPDTFGTRPSCTTIAPTLEVLDRLNSSGPLAGLLDLDRIVLAGHSAGGTMALQNADPRWFPVVGVLTYAAHTMASTMFGWPPSTVLPQPAALPTLLLAGEADGVMEASAARYAAESGAATGEHDPVARTFAEAVIGGTDGHGPIAHLGVVRGAVHASAVWPPDDTTARGFLDPEPTRPPEEVRRTLAELTTAFLAGQVRGDATARTRLGELLADRESVVRGESK